MNPDRLTTILGGCAAVLLGLQAYQAPAGTPTRQVVIGYLGAALAAAFGYLTNKK